MTRKQFFTSLIALPFISRFLGAKPTIEKSDEAYIFTAKSPRDPVEIIHLRPFAKIIGRDNKSRMYKVRSLDTNIECQIAYIWVCDNNWYIKNGHIWR
jgi:hypothetical protein